ncbi:NADH-ubiquinone oxidoreductase [Rhodotorula toruloides]|uniref:NADH-ubiquinone oxidoreductase n=1 Tax=Rhodotorula toruloides TaxID=5286 RepID=A0A511KPF5_RHOTO|nr:NADH-ubiquinone oxidoreductase [Rhodotorula toruloides]
MLRSAARQPVRHLALARQAHNQIARIPAKPHTPPQVGTAQAPNRQTTWSKSQAARTETMVGPRFEQTAEAYQPRPLAAIELIQEEPIRMVHARRAVCDGGGGALGHPRIFINLDKPGVHSCTYCGIRYEQIHEHSEHGKPAGGAEGRFGP